MGHICSLGECKMDISMDKRCIVDLCKHGDKFLKLKICQENIFFIFTYLLYISDVEKKLHHIESCWWEGFLNIASLLICGLNKVKATFICVNKKERKTYNCMKTKKGIEIFGTIAL